MDDIVAELDRWLDAGRSHALQEKRYDYDQELVQRARDEIVALRQGVADGGWVWEQLQMTHKAARDEALEQAAMRCEGSTEGGSIFAAERVAAAIRALKDR